MEKTLKLLCEWRAVKVVSSSGIAEELDACIEECEGAVKIEKRFKALHDIYVGAIEAEYHPWSEHSEAELMADLIRTSGVLSVAGSTTVPVAPMQMVAYHARSSEGWW
ncbi:hypothetical protein LCGC14_2627290, partial [marine sediment metagenome]